ncbi:YD repeat-containing protein [Armatimonadetes bacterium GXS]|jgi:YD repeat-containing protein|nr:YD repeat-containing protein [Armatimonadetes bacterium GXS]
MRAIWVIGLMSALLLGGAAQTLVLTNGDVNGDNAVDDADLLTVMFAQGQSCPGGCPEDVNGDGGVDDADLLIVMFNQGAQGAPEFEGNATEQPNGSFGRTLTLQLGDWVGGTRQVTVQAKPVGTEDDPDVPIYEWTFTVGGTATQVQLTGLPAGVYTVRAFVENDTRWLRTELSEPLAVPSGGGIPAAHVPAPAWAEEVIPTDSVAVAGLGGGPSRAHQVNLASGVYEHAPEPDLVVSNPAGPDVVFSRVYSSERARQSYASPGLPVGWTHSYDLRLEGDLNSLTLRYPNGASEVLTPQQVGGTWLLNAPAGAPYRGIGSCNQQGGYWNRVRLHFPDGSAWEFEPAGTNQYRLSRVYGRGAQYAPIDQSPPATGLFLRLEYDGSGRLTTLWSGTGVVLLSLSYSGGYLQSATARDHSGTAYATITYTVQSVQGVPCLTRVSQVNNPNAYLWEYEYTVRGGVPYLTLVRVPHPSGAGTAQSQVIYSGNGAVQMVIDGNQHIRTYTYQGTQTQVEVFRRTGERDLNWTQRIGSQNVNAGVQDGSGAQSSLAYENTYRPVQYTNRNGQTFTLTRDGFGNITSITSPRGIQWTFSYNYPAAYPVEPIVSLTVNQIGYDGSQRTPTVYEFYTATDVTQGAIKGLLARVRTPLPGTVNTGQQVETRFFYTALGNVALIDEPGPNNEGRRLTTLLFYTRDPWTNETFVERQGQPVAMAVYDKTLTLADYQAILSGNTSLRDDRLIYLERYRYDAVGKVTQILDRSNQAINFVYDVYRQLKQIQMPLEIAGSARIQETWVLDYAYGRGPLTRVSLYDGTSLLRQASWVPSPEGNPELITGVSVPFGVGYDAVYRVSSVSRPDGATREVRYTPTSFLESYSYPTTFSGAGRDTYQWSYQDGSVQDKEGNILRRLDPNGILTRYLRDIQIDSRLNEIIYPDPSQNISYEYDGFNRVVRLVKGTGADRIEVVYTYDDNDLLTSTTTVYPGLPPLTVSYAYYPDGSLARVTAPYTLQGGVPVSGDYVYEYTVYQRGTGFLFGPGRLVRFYVPWASHPFEYYYDVDGRLRRQQHTYWTEPPNHFRRLRTDYVYTERGYLRSLRNLHETESVSNIVSSFQNAFYDAAGNLTKVGILRINAGNLSQMAGEIQYAYDSSLQRQGLIGEQFIPFSDSLVQGYSFTQTLSAVKNPILIDGTPLGYNLNDQILNNGFSYDRNGNAILWRGGQVSFAYDYENRVTQVGTVLQLAYRPDGLRAWKQPINNPSQRTYYIYDGDLVIFEWRPDTNFAQAYAFGPNGLAGSYRYVGGSARPRYYFFDLWGNMIQRVHQEDAVDGVWVSSNAFYNSWGALLFDCSTRASGCYPYPTPDSVGWRGQWGVYTDVEDRSFVFMLDRYYDTLLRQFLSRNSLRGDADWNEYAYASANPNGSVWLSVAAWTDQHLFFGRTRWLGDAVGRYEVGQGSAGEVALAGAQWLGLAVLHATGIRGAVQAGVALAKGAYRLLGANRPVSNVVWHRVTDVEESLSTVASSFRGGSFGEIVLAEPLTVYRLYGGKASQLGRWYMLTPPKGRSQAVIDYAIRPEWGNTLQRLVGVKLPAGTRIFFGPAAPQGGLVGGGWQVFVPPPTQIRSEWVLFDVAFP